MRIFNFRDATDLASGEQANILTLAARSPQDALAKLQRLYDQDKLYKFGKVEIADGTYTHATKTLTKTGGFARFVLENSTRIIITAGTGATLGEYVIATRVSDDAITLATSIGEGADAQTDIDAYIIGGRTATRIERTNDVLETGIPKEGSNEAGSGLNRGQTPSAFIQDALYEFGIVAA